MATYIIGLHIPPLTQHKLGNYYCLWSRSHGPLPVLKGLLSLGARARSSGETAGDGVKVGES